MNILSALILGAIQGITEFLPISSSAHLVIAQNFIPEFTQPGILFDVILHAGTLLAVLFYFRKKIISLSKQMMFYLIIGTIPAAVFGILFQDQLEASFGNLWWIGVQLIFTGVLNLTIDFAKQSQHKPFSFLNVIWIGVWQAAAIIPGISRSSSTIFAATQVGISKTEAAEFSFLLSIPAIAGAIAVQLLSHGFSDGVDPLIYISGFVTSFIFGVASIGILLTLLKERNFKVFAYYCFIVGALIVLLAK